MEGQPTDLDGERMWLEQARQDPEIYKQLYNRYFPRLYAYASYRLGRVQDTEDLVAETFLKMFEKIEYLEWRGESSFAAWLFRVAHNLVNDFYRQNQHHEEPLLLEELPELQTSALLPDDVVHRKEMFAHLRRLIGTLSPRRQEVITLRFFGGLRNQEIAKVLGLDERTVASHLCRGLEDLHQKYVDECNQLIKAEVSDE
jgi:RNA polymerase sigma-70 factor (ECF subfamily)